MADYGVTDAGFIPKRMDTVLDEMHDELSDAWGVDTRAAGTTSLLGVFLTTMAAQVADLWEGLQKTYYSQFPATAEDMNLDNAVQYGGVSREPDEKTTYSLHCTGTDGTEVAAGESTVGTNTSPQITLTNPETFTISRENCNALTIRLTDAAAGSTYTVAMNGVTYSFTATTGDATDILTGLKEALKDSGYTAEINGEEMAIADESAGRSSAVYLSPNLTTTSVTTIADYQTAEYGSYEVPNGVINQMVTNITGFDSVTNKLTPLLGRYEETDAELRQDYIAKSQLRSNTMLGSILAELLENVEGVKAAWGYENDSDFTDERGLLPHSIKIIVDGGADEDIARVILNKKSGGIKTNGSVKVGVKVYTTGVNGTVIPVYFDRPTKVYLNMRVKITANADNLPSDFTDIIIADIVDQIGGLTIGDSVLVQKLYDKIYDDVLGVTFIEIQTARSTDVDYQPTDEDYKTGNVDIDTYEKAVIDDTRIEVSTG